MDRRWHPSNRPRIIERLDRAARDVNAVLLVLAIGLALLDFTCFFAFEVREALPPTTIAAQAAQPTAPPAAARVATSPTPP